jgi:hypothetical protein
LIRTIPYSTQRWFRTAFITAAAVALLTGCNEDDSTDFTAEGEVWKTHLADAFANNEALTSQRFDGNIAFLLEGVTDAQEANTILPMLTQGFSWKGIAYRDPLRLEADVTFSAGLNASEQPAPLVMPLLLQDNKLYVSIPMLNNPEEYFVVDLASSDPASPLPLADLTAAASVLDELVSAIVNEVDPEWIRRVGEPSSESESTPEPGTTETVTEPIQYEIVVSSDNAEHLEAAFRKGWSAWSAKFPASLGAASAAVEGDADSFDLGVGSKISLTVSPDAFVTNQDVALSFTAAAKEGETPAAIGELEYSLLITDRNQAPELTKTIPEHTLSFDHVLKFLAAAKANPASE